MILCPHCQTHKPRQGFHNHVKSCAHNPGPDRLRELWDEHRHLGQIGEICGGVPHNTVAQWLDTIGVKRNKRGWRKEPFKVYPELVRAKSANRCGTVHGKRCFLWTTCRELVARGKGVRCEAPSEQELRFKNAIP